jgi:hypothetical protein
MMSLRITLEFPIIILNYSYRTTVTSHSRAIREKHVGLLSESLCIPLERDALVVFYDFKKVPSINLPALKVMNQVIP